MAHGFDLVRNCQTLERVESRSFDEYENTTSKKVSLFCYCICGKSLNSLCMKTTTILPLLEGCEETKLHLEAR